MYLSKSNLETLPRTFTQVIETGTRVPLKSVSPMKTCRLCHAPSHKPLKLVQEYVSLKSISPSKTLRLYHARKTFRFCHGSSRTPLKLAQEYLSRVSLQEKPSDFTTHLHTSHFKTGTRVSLKSISPRKTLRLDHAPSHKPF